MEIKMSNVVGAFLIFSLLSGLVLFIYNGIAEEYDLTSSSDIMVELNELSLNDEINQFIEGVKQVTSGNPADLIGGLKAAGTGLIKALWGLFTIPPKMIGILSSYYYIPPVVAQFMYIFIAVGIAFMITRYYVGDET